jgi:hypothetical protein
MIGRLPLWTTLVPLALGVLVWGLLWRSYAADFRSDLGRLLPAGTEIEVGGFPYRLEADVAPLQVVHADAALRARLEAGTLQVNRVPWQRDRQVLNLAGSTAELGFTPLDGATVLVKADEAQASLRIQDERIARLSAVWEAPAIETGLIALPIQADRLEAHFRETPSEAGSTSSPRPATQAQLVLAGRGVRLGDGAPLTLALSAELTAAAPLAGYAAWASGGTVEIRSATLADSTGEVARMSATLVPDGAGALRIAGTIETVCPATVRAALAGLPPVSEKRVRQAELIAFSGRLPGGVTADTRDPSRPPAPVRGQEPPCPRLR